MHIIYPPEKFETDVTTPRLRVFLAGSIEMGKAEDWQGKFAKYFSEYDIDFLNPRRASFGEKNTSDDPLFREQVEWEQRGLEASDIIALYFDPNTKSPVSLLELGLFATSNKLLVCCPTGFWRKGNVDIICEEKSIPQFETLEDLEKAVEGRIKEII